jgi:mono/diheme cytochrome c family protein
MRISTLTFLFFLSLFPSMLRAQGAKTADLTPTQKLGQRVFQQRCGVCHTKVNAAAPMYGINLYKDIVDGNEDMIRDYIRNGSNRMPGFKYGLEPAEIDAIVEYLKTVPKPAPAPQTSQAKAPASPQD